MSRRGRMDLPDTTDTTRESYMQTTQTTQRWPFESPLLCEYIERARLDVAKPRYNVGETVFNLRSGAAAQVVEITADPSDPNHERVYVLRYLDSMHGSARYFESEMADYWSCYSGAGAHGRRA